MRVRILIIDSDPSWIEFAKSKLGKLFDVEVATDLETAMAKLEENRYDLVITSSGRMNVLEIIRKEHPKKRVVVATQQSSVPEAIHTYRLGALDYFEKDLRQEVVSQKIQEAIRKPAGVGVPA
jgi:DNA-binding NtrC family response regulator